MTRFVIIILVPDVQLFGVICIDPFDQIVNIYCEYLSPWILADPVSAVLWRYMTPGEEICQEFISFFHWLLHGLNTKTRAKPF